MVSARQTGRSSCRKCGQTKAKEHTAAVTVVLVVVVVVDVVVVATSTEATRMRKKLNLGHSASDVATCHCLC